MSALSVTRLIQQLNYVVADNDLDPDHTLVRIGDYLVTDAFSNSLLFSEFGGDKEESLEDEFGDTEFPAVELDADLNISEEVRSWVD